MANNCDLENKTIEELLEMVSELYENESFKPRKTQSDQYGNILLDSNNPNDRVWYENDEDYDII